MPEQSAHHQKTVYQTQQQKIIIKKEYVTLQDRKYLYIRSY